MYSPYFAWAAMYYGCNVAVTPEVDKILIDLPLGEINSRKGESTKSHARGQLSHLPPRRRPCL